jgi:hypothetical protein
MLFFILVGIVAGAVLIAGAVVLAVAVGGY